MRSRFHRVISAPFKRINIGQLENNGNLQPSYAPSNSYNEVLGDNVIESAEIYIGTYQNDCIINLQIMCYQECKIWSQARGETIW